ncbi:MAG: DUF3077 domain-containing protein [Proteobacteria bacterium]|nr:DUF3077 domain-containing protein [Pseudomonadota bacterium]
MHSTHAGAAAPRRVTAQHPFFSCSPTGDTLFSVRPNVALDDALDLASCFLASALGTVEQVAQNVGGDQIHGAAYLVEMAKAVVDAATLAKPFPAPELTSTIAFLTAQLTDSQQQAEKEEGQGKAFYEGRISAFELALSELREVAK